MEKEETGYVTIEKKYNYDEIIDLSQVKSISSLSITGNIKLVDNTSIVRVILITENHEYLVYESFTLIADDYVYSFDKICEETSLIDIEKPLELVVVVRNADFYLSKIHYSTKSLKKIERQNFSELNKKSKKNKERYKAKKINLKNSKMNKVWVASPTEVSLLPFEEKKELFGGKYDFLTGGFEYYSGGIFSFDNYNLEKDYNLKSVRTNEYVDEFDWRNRHGQNWNTSVKTQFGGTCWAFGAVAATEALVNLYFNQKIDLDLSEQEIVSCSDAGSCSGGSLGGGGALDYISSYGIVDQNCFPNGYCNASCDDTLKCLNPDERIFINGKLNFFPSLYTEEESKAILKSYIISKGVVSGRINSWLHTMALSGFGTVHAGDVVYEGIDGGYASPITISDDNELIGETYWIFKNSWGTYWGDNGYAYIIADKSQFRLSRILLTPVTSYNYSESDIVCKDDDGDGYYSWGIGEKPSTCPLCAPDQPDGDDSDLNRGPMDEFGNIAQITQPYKHPEVQINSTITWSSDIYECGDIVVTSMGDLTVNGSNISLEGDNSFKVQKGGTLLINQGTID
jgi:hypothetical protein